MSNPLEWRYATKKFDPNKKIPTPTLTELLEVLRMAPSSFGLQPWKFIIIKDPQIRQELRKYAWDQSQITDASELVILCAKTIITVNDVKQFVIDIAATRNISMAEIAGYGDLMTNAVTSMPPEKSQIWMKHQVYLALGFLLNECAHRRIDACPMEGFDAAKFDVILNLRERGLGAVVVCALGYRAEDDEYAHQKKVRKPIDQVVEFR